MAGQSHGGLTWLPSKASLLKHFLLWLLSLPRAMPCGPELPRGEESDSAQTKCVLVHCQVFSTHNPPPAKLTFLFATLL